MSSPGIELVWIKRDARIHDHTALTAACARGGPVVALFIVEPDYWAQPEHDALHWFVLEDGLVEFRARLDGLGIPLLFRTGDAVEVFAALHASHPIACIHAHEETGNGWTYARDLRVAAWARAAGVSFVERPQTGVVRRLASRDGWAAQWKRRMREPLLPPPSPVRHTLSLAAGDLPAPRSLGLGDVRAPLAVRGGETRARRMLHTFLHARGTNYRAAMSSPLEGWEACSRLSPYLAWGHLSVRTAWQATLERIEDLKAQRDEARRPALVSDDLPPVEAPDARWVPSLVSFEKRLAWHCHFMQKLEDEPAIEFRNMNRAFDGLRPTTMSEVDRARFAAFQRGETGYPLVDACVRALHQAGWINFRMRAMLASFTAYHLWLHWREPAVWMATRFQDFEPGIHYSQYQMQSGVTGINTVRIYSPLKQVADQDPEGTFIRRFVPELADVPAAWIAEPHRMPPLEAMAVGFRPGESYPLPIVDHASAYAEAKERVFAWKRRPGMREAGEKVYQKHGSRKRPSERR